MSATNLTKNLKLPQFVASDKPSWLGDVNGAMKNIDDGIGVIKGDITKASDTASSAKSQSDANTVTLGNVNTELTNIGNRVTALEAGGGTEHLEQRLHTIESDVEALQTRANTFEEEIAENGKKITKNASDIAALTPRVKSCKDNITSLQTQTSGFAESIQSLTQGQTDINGRLSITSATATNALTNSNNNSQRITALSNKVDSLDINILNITPALVGGTSTDGSIVSKTVTVINANNILHFCSPIVVEVPTYGGWQSFKEITNFPNPIGTPNTNLIGEGFYTENRIFINGRGAVSETGRFYLTFSDNKYHIFAEPTDTGLSSAVTAIFYIPDITLV